METFSTRYGYTKPSDVLIRETITPEIENAICTCYDELPNLFCKRSAYNYGLEGYWKLEKYIFTVFLNQRVAAFNKRMCQKDVVTPFILDKNNEWYRIFDLVEVVINYLYILDSQYDRTCTVSYTFVKRINSHFERLNYGYRVVDNKIVEITSEEEIKTIEDAMKSSANNIKIHLSKALELYGKHPDGDYSNSIKESISAVEAYCREKTGESTLGGALKKLESKGVVFPKVLKDAFEKLYGYTNDEKTGIRHALMDPNSKYVPDKEEAYFMLVSCSAFINYLRQK